MPNLSVAHQVCTYCIDVDDLKIIYSKCGVHEFIFSEDLVKELLTLCIRKSTEFSEIVCIAHNTKAFDAQFILKELAENSERAAPSVILSGQNITMLKYGRTKFIDSINYFQMKLSALPATFGLPESSKKGYFPHFNTCENQRYVGALPAIEFYGPDTMAPAERTVTNLSPKVIKILVLREYLR